MTISMAIDWFWRENLNRKPWVFYHQLIIGVSGENFPIIQFYDTMVISHKSSFLPMNILWMEEILHQLVDGLSHCNPIIYSVL